MNKEDIDKLLDEIKPDIKESLQKEMLSSLTYDVKQQAISQIASGVKQFVNDEIMPEIMKQLVESKEGLISVGVKAGPLVVDEISKAMCLTVSEKISISIILTGMKY